MGAVSEHSRRRQYHSEPKSRLLSSPGFDQNGLQALNPPPAPPPTHCPTACALSPQPWSLCSPSLAFGCSWCMCSFRSWPPHVSVLQGPRPAPRCPQSSTQCPATTSPHGLQFQPDTASVQFYNSRFKMSSTRRCLISHLEIYRKL